LALSGIRPHLLSPGPRALADMPTEFTRRYVQVLSLSEVCGNEVAFYKPADVKDDRVPAQVCTGGEFRTGAQEAGLAGDVPVLRSGVVSFTEEYRCFINRGQVVATSAY